jgi:signal transduction histidine kinase
LITAGTNRGRVHAASAAIEPAALGRRPTTNPPAPESPLGRASRTPRRLLRRLLAAISKLDEAAVPLILLALLALAASAFIPGAFFEQDTAADQVALDTAAKLLSTLAAVLFFNRFWRHLRLRDLLLAGALGTIAATNLLAGVLLANRIELAGHSAAWIVIAGRLAGWLLIAAAALVPNRVLRRPGPTAINALARRAGWIVGLGALVVILNAHHEAAYHRPLGDPTAMLVAQIALALLASVCAFAFHREARREGDPTVRLMALAAAFAAASALAYCAAPAFYTARVGIGDILRLSSLAALLVCVYLEWSQDERRATVNALARERRRMAADVHDLIMQDLSFALANARTLVDDPAQAQQANTVVTAGERALAGARDVVSGLTERDSLPIVQAVEESVLAAARRTRLTFDGERARPSEQPDQPTRDALLHIAREAVTNAVKHARPEMIDVALERTDRWRLTVCDDGRGFDAETRARGGMGFGLASMHRHAHTLGGALHVHSTDGGGTMVEALLP